MKKVTVFFEDERGEKKFEYEFKDIKAIVVDKRIIYPDHVREGTSIIIIDIKPIFPRFIARFIIGLAS